MSKGFILQLESCDLVSFEQDTAQKPTFPYFWGVHDMEDEDGTTEGPCPFIVHGFTGDEK
jgi:hypothetical protein